MRFNNSDLSSLAKSTNDMSARTQDACDRIGKSAFALAGSPSFEGRAASQFKSYLKVVTIRAAADLRELAKDAATLCQQIEDAFLQIEPRQDGVVDRATLTEVQSNLARHRTGFSRTFNQVSALNRQAGKFISVPALSDRAVNNSFERNLRFLDTTIMQAMQADKRMHNRARILLQRIEKLKATLRGISRIVILPPDPVPLS